MGWLGHLHPPPRAQHNAPFLSGVHTCVCLRDSQRPSLSAPIIYTQVPEWLQEHSLRAEFGVVVVGGGGGEVDKTGPSNLKRIIYHYDQDDEKPGATKLGTSVSKSVQVIELHRHGAAESFCRSRTE